NGGGVAGRRQFENGAALGPRTAGEPAARQGAGHYAPGARGKPPARKSRRSSGGDAAVAARSQNPPRRAAVGRSSPDAGGRDVFEREPAHPKTSAQAVLDCLRRQASGLVSANRPAPANQTSSAKTSSMTGDGVLRWLSSVGFKKEEEWIQDKRPVPRWT